MVLGIIPLGLFAAHLMFGANRWAASAWLMTALALALVVALSFARSRSILDSVRPALAPALLFAAVLAVAALTLTPWLGVHPVWSLTQEAGAATLSKSATVMEMFKLGGLACAFLLGCVQGGRQEDARRTLDVLVILGSLYCAVALLAFLGRAPTFSLNGRLSGGLLFPNTAATLFGILSVLGLAVLTRLWRRARNRGLDARLRMLALPASLLLLSVTCLLLTASRMGFAATIFALGAFLLWEMVAARTRRGSILVGIGVAALAAGVVLFGGSDLLWRRLDLLDGDTALRAEIFAIHWRAFQAAPMFGHGLGTFNEVNNLIMDAANYRHLWNLRSNLNVYIQWMEEAGVVGATPMFALIALLMYAGVQRARQAGAGRTLARGLVCAGVLVLVHGLADFSLQIPSVAAFWAFLLGLQYAFGQASRRILPEPD